METTKLVQALEKELNLTEKGFKALIQRKEGLVIDVKTDSGFKVARKERTEQNNILKDIDRLAIDGKASIDDARKSLKARVVKIFAPVVNAFEVEDVRRKEKAKQDALDEAERVQKIRDEINGIRAFALNISGKTSEELSGIIEAVDMIDVSENFAELTQEAMQVKRETLGDLNLALSSAIQNENLASEREQLRLDQEAQKETERLNQVKAKARERLNNLMMIPTGFFGKSSFDINVKINSLDNYEVKESEFGELFNQANTCKTQVIGQLNTMADQQLLVEKAQEKEQAEINEVHQEQKETGVVSEDFFNVDEKPVMERLAEKPTDESTPATRLAEKFVDAPTSQTKMFTVKVEWSGYSRGYSVYEVEAASEEEAKEMYYEGKKIEHEVVRDDTESQEVSII